MTNEGSEAAARAVGMDVSKTTPAASTTGRRGRRNYSAVYGAKKFLALVGGVGQQCDVAGTLERDREPALVTGAGAGDTTRKDLAPLADEAAKTRDFLVVDQMHLLHTEVADLLVRLAISLIGRWWHGSLQPPSEGDLVRIDVARRLLAVAGRRGYRGLDRLGSGRRLWL